MSESNGNGPKRRGRSPSQPSMVLAAQRQSAAMVMRRDGQTLTAIAAELGYADASGARGAIEAGLRRDWADHMADREALRRQEVARLEDLIVRCTEIVERPHLVVQSGKIVTDDDGVPLLDDGPKLRAIAERRALSERLSRMLGLDAPAKVEVTDETDRAIAELVERLTATPTEVTAPAP